MSQRQGGGGGGAGDIHRMAFLQALMARSFIREDIGKELYACIVNKPMDAIESQYAETLRELNDQLGFAKFKIKTIKSPVDCQKYVGFVNTSVDEPSKMASRYNHAQRDVFRLSLESISQSTDWASTADGSCGAPCISEIELLNLCQTAARQLGQSQAGPSQSQAGASQAGPATQAASSSKKLSKQEIRDTLLHLLSDGWLASAPNKVGYYCLGARTFLEFNATLMAQPLPDETRAAWELVL